MKKYERRSMMLCFAIVTIISVPIKDRLMRYLFSLVRLIVPSLTSTKETIVKNSGSTA